MDKIEKLQNKVLRIIHFKGPRDSTQPLLAKSRILTVSTHIKLKNCLFAFDFLKNDQPVYFHNFLRLTADIHGYNTRSAKYKFNTQMTRTVRYGSFNIPNLISKHWNELYPQVQCNIDNITKATFKKHLRSLITHNLAIK